LAAAPLFLQGLKYLNRGNNAHDMFIDTTSDLRARMMPDAPPCAPVLPLPQRKIHAVGGDDMYMWEFAVC